MSAATPVIRPLRTPAELDACVALQQEVWGAEFTERVPPALLKTVQRVGGVAAGAFDADDTLLGFVFGFSGVEDGRLVHWSDMLAVRPGHRNRGIGRRLKRYQREVLLPLGVETVYWTFDPLEARNAYVNFARLGVISSEYHENLYGETASELHRGIGTDRLVVRWPIRTERVRRRLAGAVGPARDPADAPVVNPVTRRSWGLASGEPELELDAPRVRIAVPADIQALKARAPDAAADWRRKTRAAFQAYFGRGYRAMDVARGDGRSVYLLERAAPGG